MKSQGTAVAPSRTAQAPGRTLEAPGVREERRRGQRAGESQPSSRWKLQAARAAIDLRVPVVVVGFHRIHELSGEYG